MREFLSFVIGTMLGGIVGVSFMCLLQINRLSKWEEGTYEKEKRADTFSAE
jgi:hypothetical protein